MSRAWRWFIGGMFWLVALNILNQMRLLGF